MINFNQWRVRILDSERRLNINELYSVASQTITANTEPFNIFFFDVRQNKSFQMLFRRVLQENEKLKVESTEKTKKIETLNDKISELLQKNQR